MNTDLHDVGSYLAKIMQNADPADKLALARAWFRCPDADLGAMIREVVADELSSMLDIVANEPLG